MNTKEEIEARLTELKTLVKNYDNIQNEGGYGYNPYQVESEELLDKWLAM